MVALAMYMCLMLFAFNGLQLIALRQEARRVAAAKDRLHDLILKTNRRRNR